MQSIEASALISIGPLEIKRGGRVLVKAVSFALLGGHYLEVRGDNGAGKTSLLRALAGLGNASAVHPSMFYFAHHAGFRPELTVLAQLALSLQMLGVPSDANELHRLLKTANLTHLQFSSIRTLSHGQTKRLALLLMMASQRELWLIDEPINALDAQACVLFETLLTAHLARGGMAIIATHQTLSDVLPNIQAYCYGQLHLQARGYQLDVDRQNQNQIQMPHTRYAKQSAWQTWLWSMRRELALLMAKPADVLWPALFFAMVVTMFPFTLAPNTQVLQAIAIGVLWMSALLSVLIAAQRLFTVDEEQGMLVQLHCAGLSFQAFCAAKIVANWLFVALPVVILSYLLGLLYHLPLPIMHQTALSLLLGLLSLVGLVSMFASLSLMARQAQVMMSLLALPVFVPLLIFGSAAANAPSVLSAPMWVMLSLAILSVITMPLLSAQALKLALE